MAGQTDKLFQIHEADLGELERLLPELMEDGGLLDSRRRVLWRKVQEIVKNVRWNYGPHTDVQQIPPGGKANDD